MANIKVTTVDANHIKVEFQDYYPDNYSIKCAYYNRNDIEKVEVFSDYIRVHVLGGTKDWILSYTSTIGAFIVDTVDGFAPIDNDDLALKIASLIIALKNLYLYVQVVERLKDYLVYVNQKLLKGLNKITISFITPGNGESLAIN